MEETPSRNQGNDNTRPAPDETLVPNLLRVPGLEEARVPGTPSLSTVRVEPLSLEDFVRETGCKETEFHQPLLQTCIPCKRCGWAECRSHMPQCGPAVDHWYKEHDWMIKRMLEISHAAESLDELRDLVSKAATKKGRPSS